jgi:hypothetical protein
VATLSLLLPQGLQVPIILALLDATQVVQHPALVLVRLPHLQDMATACSTHNDCQHAWQPGATPACAIGMLVRNLQWAEQQYAPQQALVWYQLSVLQPSNPTQPCYRCVINSHLHKSCSTARPPSLRHSSCRTQCCCSSLHPCVCGGRHESLHRPKACLLH